MDEKKNDKERLKEITDSIETGIKELFQSGKYLNYLSVMSRFHRYSVNNQMLIYMQKPEATLVAGFNKWKDQFSRNVKKGERGIKIIAPAPYSKTIETEKLDPDTKLPIMDADGKPIREEKTIKVPYFKVASVFDVSQTDGKPLPELAKSLTGNVDNFDVFMEAVSRSSPVPIEFKPLAENTDGFFSAKTQSITLREGMSEVQTVCAAIHEISHSKLHSKTDEKDRNTQEVEAESISYAVCKYYGIETGENSFGYIASWSADKELPELKASLETINKTASELISDIDRNYAAIMKERGLDKVQDEILPDKSVSIKQMNSYGYTADDILPLSKEKAQELFNQDVPLYMLQPDGKAEIVFDMADITDHDGLFGIEKAEWEQVKHRIMPEAVFDDIRGNGFLIYQLRDEPNNAKHMFLGYDQLSKFDLQFDPQRYIAVYADKLEPFQDKAKTLEDIYTRFNIDRPESFHGRSLSVSDMVVLKQDGTVSSHYVDSVGFREIPENYLKNAELQLEDDADMIDGIINNGKKIEEPAKTDRKKSHNEMER